MNSLLLHSCRGVEIFSNQVSCFLKMHTYLHKALFVFLTLFFVTGGVFYVQTGTIEAAGQYTWKEQADADDPTGKNWLDIYISRNGQHLAALERGSKVWVSNDGGETWDIHPNSLSSTNYGYRDGVAITNDGKIIFQARGNSLYKISSAGAEVVDTLNFPFHDTPNFVRPISIFSNDKIVYAPYNARDKVAESVNAFRKTTNGGETWSGVSSVGRYEGSYFMDVSSSGDRVLESRVSDTANWDVQLSVDGGGSFSQIRTGSSNNSSFDVAPAAISDNNLFISGVGPNGQYSMYRSDDDGQTFTDLPLPNLDNVGRELVYQIVSSKDGNKVFMEGSEAYHQHYLFTSNSAGDSWIKHEELGSRSAWSDIAMSADGSRLVAVERNGNIYTTVPDTDNPVLASSLPFSPADGETDAIKNDPTVTFSETVIAGSGNITLYNAANNSVIEAIDISSGKITGTGSDTITVSPTDGLQDGESYYILIDSGALTDIAGNPFTGITDSTVWNFTVGDNTAPANDSIIFQPADNSTEVPLDSSLSLVFPEVMEIKSGEITIYENVNLISTFETINASSSQVTGSGADTITIDPSSDFSEETNYYIHLDKGIFADKVGNEYEGISSSTVWNFTTEDATPPEVSGLSPADNSSDVTATDLYPEITFDEAVYRGTGNLSIYNGADDTVFDRIEIDSERLTGFETNTITIFPVEDFDYDANYYIQVTDGGVTDVAGNQFAGITDSVSWNFTTDTPSPAEAAANGDIVINFDQAVETGTGTVSIYELSTGSLHEEIDVTSGQVTITDNQRTAIISPSTDLDDDTSYYVLTDESAFLYVETGDLVPAITDETEWDFKTEDETAPTTSVSSPEDGGESIDLVFNEPVQTGDANIELRRRDDDSVVEAGPANGSWVTGDGTNTLTITPTESLADGAGYYFAPAPGAVTDTSGNSLPEDQYEFTTGDTEPATEIASAGDNNTNNDSNDDASTLDSFTLVFDEPVEQGSGFVTVYRSDNNNQVEAIDVTSDQVTGYGTRFITVTPTEPLDSSTSYYLHISPGAFVDSTGNDHPGVDDDSLEFSTDDSVVSLGSGGPLLEPRAPRQEQEAEPELAEVSPLCRRYLENPLRKGAANDRVDVLKLQSFLDVFADLDAPMSGIFGNRTERAVEVFQTRHADDVLVPWGYSADGPTGYVYITTLNMVNEIWCGQEFPISEEDTEEINEFRTDKGLNPISSDELDVGTGGEAEESTEADLQHVRDERETDTVREEVQNKRPPAEETGERAGSTEDRREEEDAGSEGERASTDQQERAPASTEEPGSVDIPRPASPSTPTLLRSRNSES